ncbi:MAG: alpha/beta fold hydrolase [Candidatus Syntrophosphaera sp.]|nr:alpha/beta fold hydrolase [Candidatus Syntrophosphaera sp.]
MKAVLLALALALSLGCAFGQDITGDWHGMLDIEGMKLRIVFHITSSAEGLTATFDSPDQGAFGIQVSRVAFTDPILILEMDTPPIIYTGELKDEAISGTFSQSGYELPLDLRREAMEKPVYIRPQEPQEPFPYEVEELQFTNPEAGIKLSATLTLPDKKGKHPAVILISGSGPQDRNEELMGHKPFLVIADHLTRAGIAVLRYDDRGFAASEGDFASATTLDFASDAASAVRYLQSRPEIGRIGLAGHSEGGLIAPLVAGEIPELDFIVLLAGPGLRGDRLLLLQEELIWRVDEPDEAKIERSLNINRNIFAMIMKEQDPEALTAQIREFLVQSVADGQVDIPEGYSEEDVITQFIAQMTNPWMLFFIRHDPAPILEKVQQPVLALIGSKDLQVPSRVNLEAIGAALDKAGNKNYELFELDGLNHLFQQAETGHPNEYAKIEQTIAPQALNTMTRWIKEQLGMEL